MSTLTSSGALFQLHRQVGPYQAEIKFFATRLRQLRRAIRAQWFVLFILSLRERSRLLSLVFRGHTVFPRATKAVHRVNLDGSVDTITNGCLQTGVALRLRKPARFQVVHLRGKPFFVRNSERFLLWYVLDLVEKLN